MQHPDTASIQPSAHHYLPLLHAQQEELLARLETLVNIDSGTGNVEGVNHIMGHLSQWLEQLGFSVTLHETATLGNNLVARRRGRGTARIVLIGHIDTVYGPGAACTHPFTIRDGLAYGPGVIDMKSGVVMCLSSLKTLFESGFDQFGELCVVFNNDEEIGSIESASLLRDVARTMDIGLVLESSRAAEVLTRSRKGADKYMLEVTGIPAHSGAEPHKGRSAVIELAHKIIAIHHLNILHPGITCNVTRISSSEALNVIPAVARCHISIRALDQHGLDMAATALEQIVASHAIPDTRASLTRNPGRRPYQATPAVLRLIEFARIEGAALGLHIVAEGKGGVSDANTLMEVGTPALDSLGPIGGGMHDLSREYLRLDSLPLRGALLAGLLEHICKAW